jgi:hypothetical protein
VVVLNYHKLPEVDMKYSINYYPKNFRKLTDTVYYPTEISETGGLNQPEGYGTERPVKERSQFKFIVPWQLSS